MRLVQTRRLTRRLAVAVRAIRVELQHPVPDDLSRHPTDLRRLGTRGSVMNRRERQQSAHLIGVLALACRNTDTRRVTIRAQWDRHGETPRFANLDSDPLRVGQAPRVTLSEDWYKLPDLSRLSHEEKDALILALWAQVQLLTARVAELEAKLGVPPKTPDNSSVPPSKGHKPNRAKKAERSGPLGPDRQELERAVALIDRQPGPKDLSKDRRDDL